MKSKLGILSALILSLAVAGSAYASTGTTIVKKKAPAAKTAAVQNAKTTKSKKHRKAKKATKKMKTATTPQK